MNCVPRATNVNRETPWYLSFRLPLMPHPIVEIDELLRLVIEELVQISPQTTVSFAASCRSLEEPTLSSLWKRQVSLHTLVKVSPHHRAWLEPGNITRSLVSWCDFPSGHFTYQFPWAIKGDPPPTDWERLRRYASWMRGLCLEMSDDVTDDALSHLSHNSPDGVLFPKLEWLDWPITLSSVVRLHCFRLFLFPHLKHINLHDPSRGWFPFLQDLGPVAEVISCLPASLEHLSMRFGPRDRGLLEGAVSSFVLRCGPPLRSFNSNTHLSEAALHHLMQLPNLRCWVAFGEPPRTIPSLAFPSLEKLHLRSGGLSWLHLLTARADGTLRDDLKSTAVVMKTNIKATLKFLSFPENTPVNPTLLSSILPFRNLVALYVGNDCCDTGDICTFDLTDYDVENLADALPSIATVKLGGVCGFNSCRTTVASLLSISTRWLALTVLEIHFNTRTIAGDIRRLIDRGSRCDKPRCELERLCVGRLPLRVPEEDIGTVAMGFADIFPRLKHFQSWDDICDSNWECVASELRARD